VTPPTSCHGHKLIAASLGAGVDRQRARARTGQLKGLSGVDALYEPQENPDLGLDTAGGDIDKLVATDLKVLNRRR
jgi:adenylylsulfate kinase-like enzyme